MDAFSQKLRLIYYKLFNENIDDFTQALIDYSKFQNEKFSLGSQKENKKQFFLNRKTVLRRWLQKGTRCTPDFKKSFKNYKLSHYQLKGKPLFTLEDFQKEGNEAWFDQRIEEYLYYKKRVTLKCEYRYIYLYSTQEHKIIDYTIINSTKGENGNTIITLNSKKGSYIGTFKLTDESNIFITIEQNNNRHYMLFHELNDNTTPYIVGICMGYPPNDNLVPHAQKVIFSKQELNKEAIDILFILNETERLSTIENRLKLNLQEVQLNPLIKYANRFQNYSTFFKNLSKNIYKDSFFYRLAFREFYAVSKLFNKLSKEETYYITDFQRAFLELLKSVEAIGQIPLQIVMQLNEENLFLHTSRTDLEIRSRFLNLYNNYEVETTIIFVIKNYTLLDNHIKLLLSEMKKNHIEVRTIEESKIKDEVNSLDFSFIHLNDKRDFVLADPIRDSKDVYKLFKNELIMDEYRTDYKKFLKRSQIY